jgi:hypothetical protein
MRNEPTIMPDRDLDIITGFVQIGLMFIACVVAVAVMLTR